MTVSRTQIDKLGERLLHDPISPSDYELLDAYRESFRAAYEGVVATVIAQTSLPVGGRAAKSTSAIVAKLRRGTTKLSQVQDIAGCRVVVATMTEQDKVVQKLAAAFEYARSVDRRAQPSFGYRAVHVVARVHDKPVEIQIRTELQHLWAQLSERLADRLGMEMKYGGGPEEARIVLLRASERVARIELAEMSDASADEIATKRAKLRDTLHQMIAFADERLSPPGST